MSDREIAIKDLNEYLENDEFILEEDTVYAALAALHAEEEREKGCEYCWDDEDNEPEHIGIGTDEWGRECGYLVIGEETFQVNFCPMCGRKLDGGGQDARKGEAE